MSQELLRGPVELLGRRWRWAWARCLAARLPARHLVQRRFPEAAALRR
jgi:hypothetical protein